MSIEKSIFHRKQYRKIAEILSGSDLSANQIEGLASNFADWFEIDNDRFDRGLFMKSCLGEVEIDEN